jgi:exonuclease SbcD
MNKQPIAVFSTDWHIKDDNVESVVDLVTQQCELAKKLGVFILVCLGDVFNSRKSQTLLCLNTFGRMLDVIQKNNLTLYCIPGNHDKTDYESEESFLDSFEHHPNFCLFKKYKYSDIVTGIRLHFLPFLKEEQWLSKFNYDLSEKGKNILCSHIAVVGSCNNDGTRIDNGISPTIFKEFDSVLLGHYHDMQQPAKNIFHLPSIQQNNFGENSEKGFTVLYSDGSHELVKSKFKEYIKVKIDVDKVSKKELNDLVTEYSDKTKDNYVRFVLEGTEDKIKSLNKDVLQSSGIDIKTVNKEIENVSVDFDTVEIKKYTKDDLLDEFSQFCEEYDEDYIEGIKYLNTI